MSVAGDEVSIDRIASDLAMIHVQQISRAEVVFDEKADFVTSGGFGDVFRGLFRLAPVAVKQLQFKGDSDFVKFSEFRHEVNTMACDFPFHLF